MAILTNGLVTTFPRLMEKKEKLLQADDELTEV